VLKIEPLSPAHDRETFDCGSEPLNNFLKQIARQHAERGISRTFVMVDEDAPEPKPILGFFSLTVCEVKRDSFPAEMAKRLPREIPALRLGRLAVAKTEHRRGFGKLLLWEALRRFMEIFDRAGGVGLFVDAKNDEAKLYYERFGFVSVPGNELKLFLPLKTIRDVLR
jgi:ribosomal protein S18 acetylase RimI-like enzyme